MKPEIDKTNAEVIYEAQRSSPNAPGTTVIAQRERYRVPGGWVYEAMYFVIVPDASPAVTLSSCFVPDPACGGAVHFDARGDHPCTENP